MANTLKSMKQERILASRDRISDVAYTARTAGRISRATWEHVQDLLAVSRLVASGTVIDLMLAEESIELAAKEAY